jgi:acetyltransferase
MGGPDVEAGIAILNRAEVPNFPYPDTAARIFTYMWRYSSNLKSLYETPVLSAAAAGEDSSGGRAEAVLQGVLSAGRQLLTEAESKQLLSLYGIPTVETRVAGSREEAVAAARAIGFPVVLKLYSETITHKTDVGGVKLNVQDTGAVEEAFDEIRLSVAEKKGLQHFQGVTVQPMISSEGYELIVGSSIDPQFGPVILFGMGGQLVEVFRDRALGLPPLTTTLARRMIEQTRIHEAFKGVRGRRPVDVAALEQLLVRFSEMIAEQPRIREVDINPLLASADRLVALDARVVLHDRTRDVSQLPRPAIRPYPSQYVTRWTAKDGVSLTIRPIRPEDEPLLVRLHETLSDQTVYRRYLRPLQLRDRVAHDRLARICFVDFDREIALVAERHDPRTGAREIWGVGRLSKNRSKQAAAFAVLVGDPYQGRGLGSELLQRLVDVARGEKLARLVGRISADNERMRALCRAIGFEISNAGDGTAEAHLEL